MSYRYYLTNIVEQVKLIHKELKDDHQEIEIELMNIAYASHKQVKDLYDALRVNFPSILLLEPTAPPGCYTELLPGDKVIEGLDKISVRMKQYFNILRLQNNTTFSDLNKLTYLYEHYFIYTRYNKADDYSDVKKKLSKKIDFYRATRDFFGDTDNQLSGKITQEHMLLGIKRIIKYNYSYPSDCLKLDLPNGLSDINLPLSSAYKIEGLTQAILSRITTYTKSKGLDIDSYDKQLKLFIKNITELINLDLYYTKASVTEELSYSTDYYGEDKYRYSTRNCAIKVLDRRNKNEWTKENYINIRLSEEYANVNIDGLKFSFRSNAETKCYHLQDQLVDILASKNNMSSYTIVRTLYTLTEFNKNFAKLYNAIKIGKDECQKQ